MKFASDAGVTAPQPSANRIGSKPATTLEGMDPSDSSSTSLPAESAHRNETAASAIESSTCCPPAPRSRAKSAAVMACDANTAVTLSHTVWRTNTGTPPAGSAWFMAIPEYACITGSSTARSRYGPSLPNPDSDT